MLFPEIETSVRKRLGHLQSVYSQGGSTTRRYVTYPVAVTRPAENYAKVPVYCPACRSTVRLSVASSRETRVYQGLWLLLGLTGLTVVVWSAVVLLSRIVSIGHMPHTSYTYAGLFFGGVVAFAGLVFWRSHDGISVDREQDDQPRKGHKLFP